MGSLVRSRPVQPAPKWWCVVALWLLAGQVLAGALTRAQENQSPVPPANLTTPQQTNEKIQEIAKNTHTPPRDYVIGRGDLMTVEVFEVPELTREVRVSQTGSIGLPLLPLRLFVAGLTEIQAQQKIAEVLEANGLVSHPQVMVFVKEKKSKPIAVVGAVVHPMVLQADRPLSLIELLAEAGGISPDAGDTVIVTRPESPNGLAGSNEPPEIGREDAAPIGSPSASGASASSPSQPVTPAGDNPQGSTLPANSEPASSDSGSKAPQLTSGSVPPPVSNPDLPATRITVNLSEIVERGEIQNNIALQAGDIVTVPHAGIVYALGAVQRPGGFVAKDDRAQLSTLKVLALAGGMTRIAKKGNAVIIRKDADGRQLSIPVDLGKIVKQETEDVTLRPSDILYVPDSHAKAALIRTGEIVIGVSTSLAIYRIGQ